MNHSELPVIVLDPPSALKSVFLRKPQLPAMLLAHRFAIGWTVLVTGFLLFGPLYSGRSTTAGADGAMVEPIQPGRSLLEVNGPRALIAVAFPLLFVLTAKSTQAQLPAQ